MGEGRGKRLSSPAKPEGFQEKDWYNDHSTPTIEKDKKIVSSVQPIFLFFQREKVAMGKIIIGSSINALTKGEREKSWAYAFNN